MSAQGRSPCHCCSSPFSSTGVILSTWNPDASWERDDMLRVVASMGVPTQVWWADGGEGWLWVCVCVVWKRVLGGWVQGKSVRGCGARLWVVGGPACWCVSSVWLYDGVLLIDGFTQERSKALTTLPVPLWLYSLWLCRPTSSMSTWISSSTPQPSTSPKASQSHSGCVHACLPA